MNEFAQGSKLENRESKSAGSGRPSKTGNRKATSCLLRSPKIENPKLEDSFPSREECHSLGTALANDNLSQCSDKLSPHK
jgi:hypothetical protein